MARGIVRKDVNPDPHYCWYYNVDTASGDPIDYGSVPTWREALDAVQYAMTHRDQFDNAGVR